MKFFFTLFFSFSFFGFSYEYFEELKKYKKKVCRPGTEERYRDLLLKYRESGIYIPTVGKNVDRLTISQNLIYLKQKVKWLETFVVTKKFNNKEKIYELLDEFQGVFNEFRQKLLENETYKNEQKLFELSQVYRSKFYDLSTKVILNFPFLRGFIYPVDYESLRNSYEKLGIREVNTRNKELKKKISKSKKNVYFIRKIFEEGSMLPGGRRSDLMVRAFISQYLSNLSKKSILDRNMIVDTDYFIKAIKTFMKKNSLFTLTERNSEWLERSKKKLATYQEILMSDQNKIDALIKSKANAREEIRKFIHKLHLKSYRYWLKKSDRFKRYFMMDNILLHEVGGLEKKQSIERETVLGVVHNRLKSKRYTRLQSRHFIRKYLKKKKLKTSKVLNVLFRTGEFSFTYYFIPSVIKIACPDLSGPSNDQRKLNLKIIASNLYEPSVETSALRYFSRKSMLGRIDMSKVWEGFEAFPESPGRILKKRAENSLIGFDYYYSFLWNDQWYFVGRYQGQWVTLGSENNNLYHFRDPDLFRYFRLAALK